MSFLTKEEKKRLLTKEEIENLPNHTKIMVGWANQITRPEMGTKIIGDQGFSFVHKKEGTFLLDQYASVFIPFCPECEMYFNDDGLSCSKNQELCKCPRCNYRCTCDGIFNKNYDKRIIEKLLHALELISQNEDHSDYGGDCLNFCPACIAEQALKEYEENK